MEDHWVIVIRTEKFTYPYEVKNSIFDNLLYHLSMSYFAEFDIERYFVNNPIDKKMRYLDHSVQMDAIYAIVSVILLGGTQKLKDANIIRKENRKMLEGIFEEYNLVVTEDAVTNQDKGYFERAEDEYGSFKDFRDFIGHRIYGLVEI